MSIPITSNFSLINLKQQWNPINPAAPVHILVIPKKTIPSLREVEDVDKETLGHMLVVLSNLAKDLEQDGYRVVINAGESGGQTVFQLHMHLLADREFNWPPG